jgi:hypothetical protein
VIHDWDRYLSLFAAGAGKTAIGEASAIYLSSYHPERTAARMRDRVPDARLIAIVRQPADRAWSAFQFYRAREIEPLDDFRGALAAEQARLAAGECPDIRHRGNGMYHANLLPYFETFPREQIRVYLHEEWLGKPREVLADICRFLRVDDTVALPVERLNVTVAYRDRRLRTLFVNPGRVARRLLRIVPRRVRDAVRRWNELPVESMPSDIRAELTQAYAEDILALSGLLGRDLSHWLADTPPQCFPP